MPLVSTVLHLRFHCTVDRLPVSLREAGKPESGPAK